MPLWAHRADGDVMSHQILTDDIPELKEGHRPKATVPLLRDVDSSTRGKTSMG
jgi:hypothetical protein